MTITELLIEQSTWLKVRPENSTMLSKTEKFEVEQNTRLPIVAWSEINGHFKVTLGKVKDTQLTYLGRNTLYVWCGHAAIENGKSTRKSMVLNVPFYPQTDNYRDVMRTCNSSSHAMILSFLKPGAIKGDDEYVRKVFELGDTTDHTVHTQLFKRYRINSEWRTNLDFDDLDTLLSTGYPVAIGILHRGSLANPTGGHICVIRGRTAEGNYVVNDPFGSCLDGYCSDVYNGKGAIYSRQMLNARWLVYSHKSGWGRYIHAVA